MHLSITIVVDNVSSNLPRTRHVKPNIVPNYPPFTVHVSWVCKIHRKETKESPSHDRMP